MNNDQERILEEWFQTVYFENHKFIYRFAEVLASRYCRDLKSSVDDLVQNAFCILYRKRHKLYTHENIRGWLIVTIKYLFKNAWRKVIRRRNKTMAPNKVENMNNGRNPVEEAIYDGDETMLEIIRTAINDEDKFQAFVDFHIKHVPIQTLADQYGKSYEAMKVQLYRSRKRCHAFFEKNNILSLLILMFRVTFFNLWT